MLRPAFLGSVLALALAAPALAERPEPVNVLNFSTGASVEVTHDLLTITLSAVREGGDAAEVQAALRQALEAALAEARKSAQPGAMDVRTGNFSLYPRHSEQGRIAGWQGSAELVLEGRDLPRITQTAGRIRTMTVAQVAQGLSREARLKHEGEASARAIAQFRELASTRAQQFGFTGYTLREVSVASNEPVYPTMAPKTMEMRSMAADAAPLPVAEGKGLVTVTVSGSVQLTR